MIVRKLEYEFGEYYPTREQEREFAIKVLKESFYDWLDYRRTPDIGSVGEYTTKMFARFLVDEEWVHDDRVEEICYEDCLEEFMDYCEKEAREELE